MSAEEGAHGDAPDMSKSILPGYKSLCATRNDQIKSLLYDPDNFRKLFCLDCKKHKPNYLCMKCRVVPITDQRGDLYIYGEYVGQIDLSELRK